MIGHELLNGPLGVLAVGALLGLWAYRSERASWNGGRCRCGGTWRRFDTDSQGGRGYHCHACEDVTWISWPGIDGARE